MRPTHLLRRRSWAALLVGAALALGLAAPVSATIVDRGSWDETYSFVHDDCGFDIHVEGRDRGEWRMREGKGARDDAFFEQTRFAWHEVHTANGTSITLSSHGITNEVRGTRVEGSIFRFDQILAGQPFVVRDADGKVIVRDRGVLVFTYLFDTLGDDMPGGEFIEMLDVRVHGPHPDWDGVDWGYCDLFQ